MITTLSSRKNSLLLCMTGQVQLLELMIPGWTYSPESRSRTKPYLLLEQLCYSRSNVQPTRQDAFGVSQLDVSQRYKVPLIGVEERKVMSGKSSGVNFHLLQRVVSSQPSADASQNAVDDTNTTALVLPALDCVAASVKNYRKQVHFN